MVMNASIIGAHRLHIEIWRATILHDGHHLFANSRVENKLLGSNRKVTNLDTIFFLFLISIVLFCRACDHDARGCIILTASGTREIEEPSKQKRHPNG